ncbi:hypothetical protein JDV02_003367 [Purpureocillium takamizusanense]|uniref:Ankyrin n=1 Tax=Purpureocillium takamizusanense TaxID=2060973 RepID=A0A9Q8V8D5_9HYPO|nr:uncharacterized protein JDV02_003367 [Purpureocillium takamizusanense]UNI16985.1 hypothetical protein JDV02_003367 [Purpureocillium takamizusanense]
MDGFSVTSLTTRCASIAARTGHAASELDLVLKCVTKASQQQEQKPPRPDSRSLTVGHLRALQQAASRSHERAAALEQTLSGGGGAAAVISEALRAATGDVLARGDQATGSLHKQAMRVQADNVDAVDEAYLRALTDLLGALAMAMGYLDRLLRLGTRDEQDAHLRSSKGQGVLDGVSRAFGPASQASSIILDGGSTTSVPPPSNLPIRSRVPNEAVDAPPPYAAQDPSGSSTTTSSTPAAALPASSLSSSSAAVAGPSSSAGTSAFGGFAKSIKALASGLIATKPDPFVSALCQAILRGDVPQAGGLIAQGASITGRDEAGRTPMQCAVEADSPDAALLLVAAGVPLDKPGPGWINAALPPLFQAAGAGALAVTEALLARGASVSAQSTSGQRYFVDVCCAAAAAGTDDQDRGKDHEKRLAGVELLLRHGAKATWETISGRPVLVPAVKRGNVDLARLLLRHGAKATCSDITGASVLAIAVEAPDTTMASLLLDAGAKPDSKTIYGTTVLADALSRGGGRRLDAARLLLDRGAKGDKQDMYGQPLLIGVIKDPRLSAADKEDLCARLLANGASADARDASHDVAAPCHALEADLPGVLAALLAYGAKTKHKMRGGGGDEPMLLWAADRGRADAARALLDHGADPDAADAQGRTPLLQALVRQDWDMVRLLRGGGATTTAAVADLARALSRPEVMEMLGLAVGSEPGTSRPPAPDPAPAPPEYSAVAEKS